MGFVCICMGTYMLPCAEFPLSPQIPINTCPCAISVLFCLLQNSMWLENCTVQSHAVIFPFSNSAFKILSCLLKTIHHFFSLISSLFIHSPIEKHLGFLYMLAVLNGVAIQFMSIIFCGYVFLSLGKSTKICSCYIVFKTGFWQETVAYLPK